jgi:hypothetical protein
MAMPERKRVLIVGEQPDLVDFLDPAIPPGMNAGKIRAGLAAAMAQLRARGREADLVLTTTKEAAAGEVAAALEAKAYDCVVVGAGLRLVPRATTIFEAVMNVVHERAPRARLAFNLSPDDSADAAERQLSGEP